MPHATPDTVTLQVHPPIWRRLFHLTAGSTIPIIGVFASKDAMVPLLAVLAGLSLIVETARMFIPTLNTILLWYLKSLLKDAESHRFTGSTFMVIAALFCFLLLDKGLAVAALLFLSVGDPMAAIVGRRASGWRLNGKSPVGTLALFLTAAALSLILWSADVASPLWALLAGAAIASLVEILPLPLDDNLTIPIISGAAMGLMTL
jgi:glycerol-3-phosphate acyltransferase PlsY